MNQCTRPHGMRSRHGDCAIIAYMCFGVVPPVRQAALSCSDFVICSTRRESAVSASAAALLPTMTERLADMRVNRLRGYANDDRHAESNRQQRPGLPSLKNIHGFHH